MVATCTHAIGVLDGMIERCEAALERYRARLGAMEVETFSTQRLRGTIRVMQGRLDALRESRSRQQTASEGGGMVPAASKRVLGSGREWVSATRH